MICRAGYIGVFILCLCPASGFAQDDSLATLSNLLKHVENHPELEMKRSEIEAARSRIAMRSSLMNPELILGVQNLPTDFSFHEEPMTQKVIGIGQDFPFPGKLAKERAIGEQAVAISQTDFDEKRNMLRRDVKIAWFEILHRKRSLIAYSRHEQALNDVEKEVATSAAYGKSPLSDIERITLERTEVKQMSAEELSMIAMQSAKIAYATGVIINDFRTPDSLPLLKFTYSIDDLLKMAEEKRPLLLALKASIGKAEDSIERAKLDRYPDFTVMLMYMQRDALVPGNIPQMNMLGAQVQVKLPVNYGGAITAEVAEAESMKKMKIFELEMAQREIRMVLAEKLAKLIELRTKHDLLKSSVLPSLRTIRQSFVAEYEFNKSTLQSVAESELMLLHKTHDLFEVESEYYKTIAEIEFIVGADLVPIF